MSKTAVITTRIDPELKLNAEAVLAKLGMTTAQAITMFLKQVELNQGLPFTPRLPEQNQPSDNQSVFRYAGVGKQRTYPSAQAADEYISRLRDEWPS
jgi:addiction module RelB/DinJ family antitoxin